jgi:hypothetical protein
MWRAILHGPPVHLSELVCTAPQRVAAARTRRRLDDGSDPSAATPQVAEEMEAHFALWKEASAIDTSCALDESANRAREATGWPD